MSIRKCPFHAPSNPPLPGPPPPPQTEEITDFLSDASTFGMLAAPLAERTTIYRAALAAGQPAPFTSDELTHAGRMAWRNNARCIGRLFWRGLKVRDCRHVAGAEAIFSELCAHLAEATNSGSIRPTMTVFAPSTAHLPGPRIENRQLAGYAGYRDRAQILGDPQNISFTERALAMGWIPPSTKTPFDLLPWIITGTGEKPRLFTVPPGLIREVHLTHPTLAWFGDLGLRWYAVPTISDHRLIAASTEFSAAPFSGWYMGTEIGARDLGDEARYHRLPAIAHRLGLDLSSPQSLWRDRALLELNVAVLHSYAAAGVTLVDHHTASAQFMRFATQEESAGRPLSAQWDWIVPPMSGSTTPVFHLPMTDRHLLPNFFPPASPA